MRTFAEICEELREILGAKLLAYIAGVSATSILQDWIDGKSTPTPAQAKRLETAQKVAFIVHQNHSAKVAQLWFQGTEELLGDCAPARFILETDGANERIFGVAHDFSFNH